MEGDHQKNEPQGSNGRDVDIPPGRIHEYVFFLTQDEEGCGKVAPEPDPEKRPKAGKGKKRINSKTFFLSE